MTKTIEELVTTLRTSGPAAVRKIDEATLTKLARATLATVAKTIDAAPDGKHVVAGLGVFQVRTIEPAEGKKGGRRVLFVAKPPKVRAPN